MTDDSALQPDHQVCHFDLYRDGVLVEQLEIEDGSTFKSELEGGEWEIEVVSVESAVNYGELADETLGDLTAIEEMIEQLERGNSVSRTELKRVSDSLSDAQSKQIEMQRRYEEVNGPI